jgi:hypothetical protein
MTAFWDIVACSLVEAERRFKGGTESIIRANMEAVRTSETPSVLQRDNTALYPRKLSSLYSPLRELEISKIKTITHSPFRFNAVQMIVMQGYLLFTARNNFSFRLSIYH